MKMLLFLIASLGLLATGCSKAKYKDPAFNGNEVDRIVVLPFIDNRRDPDPEHNFDSMCADAMRPMFSRLKFEKGYRAVYCTDRGGVSSYTPKDLPGMDKNSNVPYSVDPHTVNSEWVKQLGPSSANWVLIPVLEELSDFNALIVQGGQAVISMYLFNKESGKNLLERHFSKQYANRCFDVGYARGHDRYG